MIVREEQRFKPDDTKFRELILYIIDLSEGDDSFGATKLNKLLFLADFLAYLNFETPITGQEYQCLQFGPAPRYLKPIRDAMIEDDDIAIQKRDYYGWPQDRLFALRSPNLKLFSANEIDLVNRIIHDWWGASATDLTNYSHKFAGWLHASEGETIPYEVALVGARQPDTNEIEYGRSLQNLAAESLAQ